MTARRFLAFFLPLAVLLTGGAVLLYAAGQQVYRNSANDPQTQIARHVGSALDAGLPPRAVTTGAPVNLASSLDTHVSVYGPHGHLLASTARLAGSIPQPPPGVIRAVSGKDGAQHALTWQPRSGVRVAAVVTGWKGGAVLVGRSLGPTESRETDLERLVGAGWLAGLVLLGFSSYVAARLWPGEGPLRTRASRLATSGATEI